MTLSDTRRNRRPDGNVEVATLALFHGSPPLLASPFRRAVPTILPAEGHLFDLLEPEEVVPEWKRWSPILLRPEGLYGTRPADGGNKAAKLRAIREALRTAKRVWLATDCDREGQLIGQEILEHYEYRGQVMRVLFTAQDSRPSATPSVGQNPMLNMLAFTPPPLRAGRPIKSTTSRSPAPRPSFLDRALAG